MRLLIGSAVMPEPDSNILHVLPINDLIEHEDIGDECICGPDVEYLDDGKKIICHHSLDGREENEK